MPTLRDPRTCDLPCVLDINGMSTRDTSSYYTVLIVLLIVYLAGGKIDQTKVMEPQQTVQQFFFLLFFLFSPSSQDSRAKIVRFYPLYCCTTGSVQYHLHSIIAARRSLFTTKNKEAFLETALYATKLKIYPVCL